MYVLLDSKGICHTKSNKQVKKKDFQLHCVNRKKFVKM